MAYELLANLVSTTLSASISSTSATSCTVASATGFPVATLGVTQFRVNIDNELIIVTNTEGTKWTISRGAEGTTAATHSSGATVTQVWTVASVTTPAAARDEARMATLAASDGRRSSGLALAAYQDAQPNFVELWPNLNNWSVGGANGSQVSAGRVYGGSAPGGSTSGMNYSFPVPTGGVFRAVTTVDLGPANASDYMIFGVSTDAAGATPTSAAGAATGIAFLDADIHSWVAGTDTDLGAMPAASQTWGITMIADGTNLTFTVSRQSGVQGEFRYKIAQPTGINNIYLFVSDANALSGRSFGPVGVSRNLSTITPRAGIEGVTRTVHWTTDAVPNNFKITLPANYDSRIPSPLAICFHGNGADENLYSDNGDTNATAIGLGLLAAGYIVLTATQNSNGSSWGAQGSLDAYYNAYIYARDHYNIGPVVLHGDSMGNLEAALTIAGQRIPGIVAYMGGSPALSLLACAITGSAFLTTINTAYGITQGTLSGAMASTGLTSVPTTASFPTIGTKLYLGIDTANAEIVTTTGASTGTAVAVTATAFTHLSGAKVSDYPTKTAGHDPMLLSGDAFLGVPIKLYASASDTTVIKASNADVFGALLAPYAKEATVVAASGTHTDASNYPVSTTVAFFNSYTGGAPLVTLPPVNPVRPEQRLYLPAAYTLTSSTSAQKLFNVPSTGAFNVDAEVYEFECEFDLTGMSATSGTFSFLFGGTATIGSIKYWASAQKSAAVGTLATWPSKVVTVGTASALVAATTTTTGAAVIRGVVEVTAPGTLIPEVKLSVASAAVVGAGSWFRLTPGADLIAA
jgi:hypothetical protein